MSELVAPPGTIVARGREIRALNWAGRWLAPGSPSTWPAPDAEGWTVVRWGESGGAHIDPHLNENGRCQCDCPECVSEWEPMQFGGARRRCICPDCDGGDCPNWRLDKELHEAHYA